MMRKLTMYLAVGAGSGLGAGLRYAIAVGAFNAFGAGFPWATLVVNMLGSALIVGCYHHAQKYPDGGLARWKAFWITGFCGGFTTFSLFSLEVWLLWQEMLPWRAVLYLVLSISSWLVAAGWMQSHMLKKHRVRKECG